MIEVPLFPLHAVLCPGVPMPLHVFEPRYRALVRQCLADNTPFGVILIREGREVGPGSLAVAEIGTFAEIRQATRYEDGRFDVTANGTGRFRLIRVIVGRDPFLVGVVEPLDDELGDPATARALSVAATHRFIRYLELLQPGDGESAAEPPIRAEIDLHITAEPSSAPAAETFGPDAAAETVEISSADLTIPDEPTALSYLLTAIVELDLPRRQALLEAATTELRLGALAAVLDREIDLLGRRLRIFSPEPRVPAVRRN
ncbi:MAG TPA: LON peptidase substrate-binding domain-containing protein [Candidatus Limnocylindrales bacterium]|nr:LON peptidase substrate-binding domain-containing protein [Candidatus Limnocylindrales bacterium]